MYVKCNKSSYIYQCEQVGGSLFHIEEERKVQTPQGRELAISQAGVTLQKGPQKTDRPA